MNQELGLKEIQALGIEIISCIDQYARVNNLHYYMAGGTLLGAVRHKGFIPWDDDVDLMMPRPDYELFIRNFSDKRYKVSSCEYDEDYNTPFARVWDTYTVLEFTSGKDKRIGVFVDIFPIDGYPSKELVSKIHTYRLKLRRTQINAVKRYSYKQGEKHIPLKKLLRFLWRHNGNYYSKKLNRLALKYGFDNSAFVGVTTTTDHLFRERNNKEIFASTVYLDFEGMKLPAPSGYETYLKKLYGDYMELPPEEKRKTEHSFFSFMKEDVPRKR